MPGCIDLTGSKGSIASTGEYLHHMFFTTIEGAVDGSPLGMVIWGSAVQHVRLVGLGVFKHGGRRFFTANFREYGALTVRGTRFGEARSGDCLMPSAAAPGKRVRAITMTASMARGTRTAEQPRFFDRVYQDTLLAFHINRWSTSFI